MGSSLAAWLQKPTIEDLPKVLLRLVKVPEDYGFGGDKGFTALEKDFLNVNACDTPVQLANSNTHCLSSAQIESDIPITTVRALCETVFWCTAQEAIITETIPYDVITWLPHGHILAHGKANFNQPLRQPGRNSIVGDDYWSNDKNYTCINQQRIAGHDIELSVRRKCSKYGKGGIVQFCVKCRKWFHPNGICHDFDSCVPVLVHITCTHHMHKIIYSFIHLKMQHCLCNISILYYSSRCLFCLAL